MLRKSCVLSTCLVVGALLLSVEAVALQVVLSAEETAVITNPENRLEKRVLATYEVPEFLRTSRILYAQLAGRVDAVLAADDGVLEIEAAPVTTAWSASGVSWFSPWRNAGGDVDAGSRGSFLVRGAWVRLGSM